MTENAENPETEEKRKPHKRKSVLKNARKYAKKKKFGRGSTISEDNYQYLVHCLEKFEEGFPNEEEKTIFATNVLQQTENQEVTFSCNQIGCRVIEKLLPFAHFSVTSRYINTFNEDLRTLCSDAFASFVLQSLLKICGQKSLEDLDTDTKTQCREFLIKVSKFLLNNLEDFVYDIYANNVIRTVLESLSNFKDTHQDVKEEIPEEYLEIVTEYATRLMLWPQFKDFAYEESTSGLLQTLLKVLHKVNFKLLKKMQKKLLDESFAFKTNETEELLDVFKSKSAVNLLEVSISVATEKSYTQIYAKCFFGNLSKLATCKISNFAVQKLIGRCKDKTEFEAMFDELADNFEDILKCRYTGVLLAIAQTCKKLVAKQGNFIKSLMKALHCEKPQENQSKFIVCVATLLPFEQVERVENKNFYVNVHGSVLLQTMLDFNKPIKIVQSILDMDVSDLKTILFMDKKGSHVVDAYMKSPFVGEKSREKLIKKMLGSYQELAASVFGSRALESLWQTAQLAQKIQIMDELSYKGASWANTKCGRIIFSKFNVDCYKRNKAEWKQTIGKTEKKKSLFSDILEK